MDQEITQGEARRRSGQLLRKQVPRSSHAGWEPPADRRDPIEILMESSQGRVAELVPLRYGRMARSPFAFLRGGAAVMASDLSHTPNTGLRVQASGDCHLANFGGFATPERRILFDLNDFDETLPAAWEWDVKRLAASFVMASRENGVGASSRSIVLAMVGAYRARMAQYSHMSPLDCWYASVAYDDVLKLTNDKIWRRDIRKMMKKALSKTAVNHDMPRLTHSLDGAIKIRDNPPLLYHLPEQSQYEAFELAMKKVIERYRESLFEFRRTLFDRYEFVDAAIKVVGVGSVGTYCCIGLLMADGHHPLFLQVKEARESVLAPYFGCELKHQGRRIVVGQRKMQAASDIFLGWTEDFLGRQFYARQLRDTKISPNIAAMDAFRLRRFGVMCGWVLARAHARTGDAQMLSGYLGESDTFDRAVADFAQGYADQTERDHALLVRAIESGRVTASDA